MLRPTEREVKALRPSAYIRIRPYLARVPAHCEVVAPKGVGEDSWAIRFKMGQEERDLSKLPGGPLYVKFANWGRAPSDIASFTRKYGGLVSTYAHAFRIRWWRSRQEDFRAFWVAKHKNPKGLVRTFLRAYPSDDEPWSLDDLDSLFGPTQCDFVRNGVVVTVSAHDTWTYLILCLLTENLDSLRKCKNSECDAPYFVAGRKDQEFCRSYCARLVTNRRWWRKKGKQWRQERKKKTRR